MAYKIVDGFFGDRWAEKNGVMFARCERGTWTLMPQPHTPAVMTRSQAFRHWGRHFPEMNAAQLPAFLRAAVNLNDHDVLYYEQRH